MTWGALRLNSEELDLLRAYSSLVTVCLSGDQSVAMAQGGTGRGVDKLAVLRKAELFATLPENVLKSIADRTTARELKAGQILFSEREEASALYVVAYGKVRSIRHNVRGRQQVLSTEGTGAVLALAPMFNGRNFYSTTIAETPAEVLRIDKRDLHSLCREHMDVFWSVARVLAHKLRRYAELIEALALQHVDQRLARYILSTCEETTIPDDSDYVIDLGMTRAELASRIGSTREVVSRALSHLQDCGLIQITGVTLLRVPSLQALRRFADNDDKTANHEDISDISSELA